MNKKNKVNEMKNVFEKPKPNFCLVTNTSFTPGQRCSAPITLTCNFLSDTLLFVTEN